MPTRAFKRHLTLPFYLQHLFINGKCWCLFHHWYSNSRSVIRLDHDVSQSSPVCRGVKQGYSVSKLLTKAGLAVSSSAHADDIRVMRSVGGAVSRLGSCVDSFCTANLLKLNFLRVPLLILLFILLLILYVPSPTSTVWVA